MSELTNESSNIAITRRRLLAGASVLVLVANVSPSAAVGAEQYNSTVWIELGGQLSRLVNGEEAFEPVLFDARPSKFTPSERFERAARYGFEETGSMVFQPQGSDWVFSASVRYGRSSSDRHVHQQTYPGAASFYLFGNTYAVQPAAAQFADTVSRNSESHSILDFQVGKEVGLGLFGQSGASSLIELGVRFAQFSSKANISLKSDPDWHFQYKYVNIPTFGIHTSLVRAQPYHSNWASFQADRSFHGIGPSLFWKSSMPFVGNRHDGQWNLDWGVNAALLFGKQKVRVHHQTTGHYQTGYAPFGTPPTPVLVYHPAPVNVTRAKSITVPNVGGFAGISYQFANAKLSLGYRADFFFGAMDGGIDARKSFNRDFYGPYATVSIGLGG
jgi:hypothetical protein